MAEVATKPDLQNSASSWPPSWQTMPHGIRVGRYTDPAFQKLEFEKLWNRVWQVAARLDEIPKSGDYTVYKIGDQSVLVVRVDADTVKAYYNFCPHRGTALGEGIGTFERGRIVCPFHGWRWNLEGQSQLIIEQQEFRGGHLQNGDVALREVKSAVLAGLVFINLDPGCEPFDDYIAPMRQWLEDLAIGDMHHHWWKSISVPANWKVAQEAFLEAYHVSATHPQLDKIGGEIIHGDRVDGDLLHQIVKYEAMPKGHGRFFTNGKAPISGNVQQGATGDLLTAMEARLSLLVEGMDAMVLPKDLEVLRSLRGKAIPEGSSLGGEFTKALYADAAEKKRPMPKFAPETLGMWGGELFLFPNFMILPQAGNVGMYRSRPDGDDPNRCIFEIFSTTTYPAAEAIPRATVQHVTDLTDPEQLRLIPRQDLGNIPRMQVGLRSSGMRQTWLAINQERIILNMHEELDRYLQA